MNPKNQYHSEFYDNHAYLFDEPHTIPAGWDAEALMQPNSNGHRHTAGETGSLYSSLNTASVDRDDAKNPLS